MFLFLIATEKPESGRIACPGQRFSDARPLTLLAALSESEWMPWTLWIGLGRCLIYAATACRFLRDSKWLPEDRLPLVLQGHTIDKSPTQQLDDIYVQILKYSVIGNCDGREKEMLSERFRKIVGFIVILFDSLPARSPVQAT
jgi:hypothetical protein